MSGRRFAAITASLLARKGEAMPSVVRETPKAPILWSSDPRHPATEPLPEGFAKPEEFATELSILRNGHGQDPNAVRDPNDGGDQEHDITGDHDHGDLSHFSDAGHERRAAVYEHGERRHRISLALSQQEHERLGIVAVKKGLTRHQLMRDALDFYFEKLASEYKSDCACIATGGCRNGCEEA